MISAKLDEKFEETATMSENIAVWHADPKDCLKTEPEIRAVMECTVPFGVKIGPCTKILRRIQKSDGQIPRNNAIEDAELPKWPISWTASGMISYYGHLKISV